MPGSRALVVLVLAAASLVARSASAHDVGVSRGEWTVDGAQVHGELAFARSELLASFDNADPLAVDVVGRFDVSADGAPCDGALDDARAVEGDGARFRVTWTCPRGAKRIAIAAPILDELPRGHRIFARAKSGGAIVDDVLREGHESFAIDVAPSADARAAPARGFASFVLMGIAHVLGGWDHLVFLLGLVLVGGRAPGVDHAAAEPQTCRPLVGVVTAFTLAHSVTLALAVLGIWAPSPRVVEPAIALSIAYVGVENFVRKDASKRWRVAMAFGLVHGFGFAGALRAIDLPRAELPPALFGFNVGVELGQLAVMALVLPALALLRDKAWLDARGVRALSGAIALAGVAWFVARVAA